MMRVSVEEARTESSRLEEMYLRHFNDGVRLAYLITGDLTLSEDLVQDAFVRLASHLLHLRDPNSFEPYLRRTIVNLANAYFRRRKVERRYLERQAAVRPLETRDESPKAQREPTLAGHSKNLG